MKGAAGPGFLRWGALKGVQLLLENGILFLEGASVFVHGGFLLPYRPAVINTLVQYHLLGHTFRVGDRRNTFLHIVECILELIAPLTLHVVVEVPGVLGLLPLVLLLPLSQGLRQGVAGLPAQAGPAVSG